MMYALGSGYPVAFALPGAAIVTITLAGLTGSLFEGDSGAYFIQDGPIEWLTAGVTNFRGIYWEVERDTLIAIPLFIFMGIMLQRSKIAEDLLVTMAQLFGPVPGWFGYFCRICRGAFSCHHRYCWRDGCCDGFNFTSSYAAEQLFQTPCNRRNLRIGTLGQIIPPSIVLIILADQLASAADQAATARKALYTSKPPGSSACRLNLTSFLLVPVICSSALFCLAFSLSVFTWPTF